MKRAFLLLLLLSLCLAGCGIDTPMPKSETAAPPESIPPKSQAPVSIESLLPPFPQTIQENHAAFYENVEEDVWDSYLAGLEDAGLQALPYSDGTLFYTEKIILWTDSKSSSPYYCVEWAEADPSAPVPDQEAIQALMPEKELICLVDQTPADLYEATGLHKLFCVWTEASLEKGSLRMGNFLLGSSVCVPQQNYMRHEPEDELLADLDGDGKLEFVYWCGGPSSGVFTRALWAYGTEDGVPIVKAHSILTMRAGDTGLQKDGSKLYFRYADRELDRETYQYILSNEQHFPLRIENGRFLINDGKTPEWIEDWNDDDQFCVGQSFAALRERKAAQLVYASDRCFVWTDTSGDPASAELSACAALTDNGVAVTGCVRFSDWNSDRLQFSGQSGLQFLPIHSPDDLDALAGLNWDALAERLGPWHFSNTSDGERICGWIAEDGTLLEISGNTVAQRARLIDLSTGEVLAAAEFDA